MFRDLADYKPDIDKTLALLGRVEDDAWRRRGGNVTFRALPPVDLYFSEIDLTAYDFQTGLDRYARDLCLLLAAVFDTRREIDDNFVPSVSPVLGIGDYSAFVAGEIVFQPDTSWSTPCLGSPRDWQDLPPLGSAPWYARFLAACERLLAQAGPAGIPFTRGFFSPLDLAGALRGDALYTDFYDDPAGVDGLLDYCATATIRLAEDIRALARRYLGGSRYGLWYLDGKINLSEDIACLISPKMYRTFAAPHTQRVIDHFGRAYMHTHSRAMYLVQEICALRGVVDLWLATDPNQPRPIEHVPELVAAANGVNLAIDCATFGEIEAAYRELKRGNFAVCLPVADVREGIELARRFERLK